MKAPVLLLTLIVLISCRPPKPIPRTIPTEVLNEKPTGLPGATDMVYIIPAEVPPNILDSLQVRHFDLEMIEHAYRSRDSLYYYIEVQKSLNPAQGFWFQANGVLLGMR